MLAIYACMCYVTTYICTFSMQKLHLFTSKFVKYSMGIVSLYVRIYIYIIKYAST